MIDYEILRLIWWLFIGVLLVGFAIMDGQDMGVGSLLPFLGKNDTDRRCMINSVAPHWDGNQVWLLTGGGAIFAAWPLLYGAAFSGFYWAMLIVLLALILRPVGFDFRGKMAGTRWRNTWDWALFVGSAVPPIIFGVAFDANLEYWAKIVSQEGLTWTNTTAEIPAGKLASFSPTWKAYGLLGIPANFLIDTSTGLIIAKNLRGNELDNYLAQLLP